jgi:thioredoxin-related protein
LLTEDQFKVLAAEFGISGIPHYVLIDKKGNIVSKSAARPSQKELLIKFINNIL